MKTADELIKNYLADLKIALRGADKATIQDALADAEEHLTNMAKPKKSPKHIGPGKLPCPPLWLLPRLHAGLLVPARMGPAPLPNPTRDSSVSTLILRHGVV